MLAEAGVPYTFDKKEAKEVFLYGYTYAVQHKRPDRLEWEFVQHDRFYTFSRKYAERLIDHWNRTDSWKYTLLGEEPIK